MFKHNRQLCNVTYKSPFVLDVLDKNLLIGF